MIASSLLFLTTTPTAALHGIAAAVNESAPSKQAAAAGRESAYFLSGVRQLFTSVPPNEESVRVVNGALRPLLLSRIIGKSSINTQAETSWTRVAASVAARRELRVVILGASTTVGCGSADPLKRCDIARSWPRLFHDALRASLSSGERSGVGAGMGDVRVRTSVHAKNAVEPTYFAQCTGSFVEADAHVVLIELFSNLFGVDLTSNHTSLDTTIAAVREAAPMATLLFVVWLKERPLPPSPPSSTRNSRESREAREKARTLAKVRGFIRAVASRHRADVVDVPSLLERLASGDAPHQSAGLRIDSWYARDGRDHHPNGRGHLLMAIAAAHAISSRLSHAPPLAAADGAPTELPPTALYRPPARGGGGGLHPVSCRDCASGWAKSEMCHNSADTLPVTRPLTGSWALRDEGGDKGVQKLGWVSTALNESLLMKLDLSGCPAIGTVRLAYLLSSRPGQGVLYLKCVGGCTCWAVGRRDPRRMSSPFPLVETDVFRITSRFSYGFPAAAELPEDGSSSAENASNSTGNRRHTSGLSVTSSTTFYIANVAGLAPTGGLAGKPGDECRLNVTHVARAADDKAARFSQKRGALARSTSRSRVRVDGVSMTLKSSCDASALALRGRDGTDDVFPAGSHVEVRYGSGAWWKGTVQRTYISRTTPAQRMIVVLHDDARYPTPYVHGLRESAVRLLPATPPSPPQQSLGSYMSSFFARQGRPARRLGESIASHNNALVGQAQFAQMTDDGRLRMPPHTRAVLI